MRYVLRDSGSDIKKAEESQIGFLSNVDMQHLKHVGLFRLHGGYAISDDMKESLKDKFKDLMEYSKYKVSMDCLSIHHLESDEVRKVNSMFEKLEE